MVGESSTIKTFMPPVPPPCAMPKNTTVRGGIVGRTPGARSALGAQERLEVGDQIRDVALAGEQPEPPLGIEYVGARSVIDAVAVGRLARYLLIEDLELLRHPGGRLSVPVEAEKARIEGRRVGREHVSRISFRVDRDEENLHALAVLPELIHRSLQLRERGGTYVGAARVAEKHHDHPAAEVRQRARLAGVVGQRELLAVVGPGYVGVLERRARTAARGERRRGEQRGEKGPQVSAHR